MGLALGCASGEAESLTGASVTTEEAFHLVAETGASRLGLWSLDGVDEGGTCMADLLPASCSPEETGAAGKRCQVFGPWLERDAAGDRVLLPYVRLDDGPRGVAGGVLAFTPGDPPRLQWTLESLDDDLPTLEMPHRVARWDEDTLVVVDTGNDRVVWVVPGEPAPVLASLGPEHPEVGDARNPNDLQLLDHDGRRYLLLTWLLRLDDGAAPAEGQVQLWEVTDPAAPVLAWRYPPTGYLHAPHHARLLVDPAGRERLVYAHSRGAAPGPEEDLGSIGTAAWSWSEPPAYEGDFLLPPDQAPLGFVRAVEPAAGGGRLLVTDSGCQRADAACEQPGRLLEVAWPEPLPEAVGGAWTEGGQHFGEMAVERVVVEAGLVDPFEAVAPDPAELAGNLGTGVGCR